MSLPWSPQQREWLQVLGHPLLVLRSTVPAEAEAAAHPTAAPPAREAAAEFASMPTAGPDQPLHRALLKATGLPADEAARALRALAVDAAVLRADPAAKRQLWARLRRLRGSRKT